MKTWCAGRMTWGLAFTLVIAIAALEAARAAEREQANARRTEWTLPDGILLSTMMIGAWLPLFRLAFEETVDG
jgi:hypothetical protein